MKKLYYTILPAILTLSTSNNAHAVPEHIYANTITTHNIATLQHHITQTAFNAFEGSIERHLYSNKTQQKNTSSRKDIYGTMQTYGEYNDDGSFGRNGGDTINPDLILNNVWINYQHLGDDAKIDNISALESNFDMIIGGLAGGEAKMGNGISKWGIYGGYIGGKQENKSLNIDEQGGFVGVYNGFDMGQFNLSSTIIGGTIDNSAKNDFGSDDYTNLWIGGTINATYDIPLDETFTIRPGAQIGYTWIKSKSYTSASSDIIKNDNFSIFEVSPEIRMLKHIGNGWLGSINGKYVMLISNGGDITLNTSRIDRIKTDNFFEYGISLEKHISKTNISLNIGRRDSNSRYGWIGGINIKHIF